MLKKSIAAILATAMVFTLSACGGSSKTSSGAEGSTLAGTSASALESTAPESAKKDEVVIALSSDATSLDPYYTDETVTNAVNLHIFETLVFYDKDLKNVPGLAETWTLSDDGLTWTFNLRKDVKFHNGNPFNAQDVVYSFNRVMTDTAHTAFTGYLATVKEVIAKDDYTVEIKTEISDPLLIANLRNVCIMDKETTEPLPYDQVALAPVGTGRYKFVEQIKEDHIDLIANEEYWGGKPEINKVRFRPISNEATRTATMLSGDVDVMVDIAVRDVDRLEKTDGIKVIKQPSLRVIYLNLDGWRDASPTLDPAKPNPLKDIRVRQAMYHAIDMDTIVKNVMNGHAYPAATYIPQMFNGYNPDIKRLPYDLEKAKSLMKEAGYENGFEITLDASNDRYVNDGDVAQAVASYLEKIGIKVKLNLMPKSLFFTHIKPKENKSSFLMTGWADTAGEGIIMAKDLFYTFGEKSGFGGVNRGHYTNPQVDKLIEEAMGTADSEKRAELVRQIDKLVTDEVGYIPLHFEEDLFAAKSNVNYVPRANKYVFAWDVSFS